jgi:hypothetical protein
MQIPTDYDLGNIVFTVLPRTTDTLTPLSGPELRKQVEQCITVSNLLRWKNGLLSLDIDAHHPPVDLAFHIVLQAGNREWNVGDIFAVKGSDEDDTYTSFLIEDARQLPAKGLTFKFKPDPEIARRSLGLEEYWNEDVTINGLCIDHDDYQKSQN